MIALGAPLRSARDQAIDGGTLIVDADSKPLGWLASGGLPDAALAGAVTAELLNLGGTLATEDGTLREVLDAALSSPSGRGVVIEPDGRFAGTISASRGAHQDRGRARPTSGATRCEAGARAPVRRDGAP